VTTALVSWALGITGLLMLLLGGVTLIYATPLLVLTHLVCFVAGLGACWPLRHYFRARVVDDRVVLEYHRPEPVPGGSMFRRLFNRETLIPWIAVLAALVVIAIGWKGLEAGQARDDRITKLECDDAWLWLSLINEARTEKRTEAEGPRTPEEEARLDRFEANYRQKIRELECEPPSSSSSGGSEAMGFLFGTPPVVTVVRQTATPER
jgi:hypothetical protein